jgi:hypothetical protein
MQTRSGGCVHHGFPCCGSLARWGILTFFLGVLGSFVRPVCTENQLRPNVVMMKPAKDHV